MNFAKVPEWRIERLRRREKKTICGGRNSNSFRSVLSHWLLNVNNLESAGAEISIMTDVLNKSGKIWNVQYFNAT